GNLPGQDLMQRALSSKSERVAQWSAYFGGSLYLVVGLIPVALGMIGSVLMPGLQNPEEIVPRLAMEYLPPAGLALFLGALFSALMSSADSGLLAPASVFGQNIVRNLAPDLKPKEVLAAVRVGVVIFCGLALAVALWFQSVYTLMVESWTVMMVGLFGPLTLGMYWKRTNTPGCVSGILAGLVVWLGLVGLELVSGAASPDEVRELPNALIATPVSLLVTVAVSLLTAKSHPPRALTDPSGAPIEAKGRLGTLGLRPPASA
ncbi:MAG: hypothetical protein OXU35_00920, partial [Acidobacteriota bacterium]|nr:hypothetical protein [Acidobacteriota bacterium]